MQNYRHFIWDFDGTLFDSYPHSTRALYVTARHFGVDVRYDDVSRAIRHSFARAFALVGLTEEQLRYFRALHGDGAFPPPIVPFPDAAALDTFIETLYEIYPLRHCKSFHKKSGSLDDPGEGWFRSRGGN